MGGALSVPRTWQIEESVLERGVDARATLIPLRSDRVEHSLRLRHKHLRYPGFVDVSR